MNSSSGELLNSWRVHFCARVLTPRVPIYEHAHMKSCQQCLFEWQSDTHTILVICFAATALSSEENREAVSQEEKGEIEESLFIRLLAEKGWFDLLFYCQAGVFMNATYAFNPVFGTELLFYLSALTIQQIGGQICIRAECWEFNQFRKQTQIENRNLRCGFWVFFSNLKACRHVDRHHEQSKDRNNGYICCLRN